MNKKKTFGDLKTGDTIFYVDYDELAECFKIYEYEVFVSRDTISEDCIVLGTVVKNGYPWKHHFDRLILKDCNSFTTFDNCGFLKHTDYIFIDEDEAKDKCLSLMFELCEEKRKEMTKIIENYRDCCDILKSYFENKEHMKVQL